jgi:hypothetical protein
MDTMLLSAMSGMAGTLIGGTATVAPAWVTQQKLSRRELVREEVRKREALYGEFITEAARLLSDAFDHTLDKPETLVKLYAILGRIRLVSSEAVFKAAEECSSRILDFYATPNRTVEELIGAIRSDEMAFLRKFSDACHVELRKYSQY